MTVRSLLIVSKLAHSAEHAFVGALQQVMQKTVAVKKVEHKGDKNSVFIVDDDLTLERILEAESIVNSLIAKGARITEREFESLDEARAAVPSLRANEKRISGKVRVVEIAGHDLAACNMEHANDLRECDFFLVTGFGRTRGEFHVEFAVGEGARKEARRISSLLISVCSELGANANTLENTVKKLRLQNQESVSRLKEITKEQLERSRKERIREISFVWGHHTGLDEDQVVESAWSLINGEPAIFIIVNSFGEMAQVVLARSEQVSGPDLNVLLRQCPGNARGGGRAHFVTGLIDSKMAESFLEFAISAVKRNLTVG